MPSFGAVPKLFEYLDTLTPITESGDELPPFVVSIASGHNLDPIPHARPMGKQVMFAVGAPKSSVPNRHLFIGESISAWLKLLGVKTLPLS
jgi:hypothetical protein